MKLFAAPMFLLYLSLMDGRKIFGDGEMPAHTDMLQ